MGGNSEIFHNRVEKDTNRGGFIVVSTKQFATFAQHIARSSFYKAHSSQ